VKLPDDMVGREGLEPSTN